MNWFTTWVGIVASGLLATVPFEIIFGYSPNEIWAREVFWAGGAFAGCHMMRRLKRAGW